MIARGYEKRYGVVPVGSSGLFQQKLACNPFRQLRIVDVATRHNVGLLPHPTGGIYV